jgi:hypothetical protein
MLRLIPDLPETRNFLTINSHARIRELYHISLPPPETGVEARDAYIAALLGPSGSARVGELAWIAGIGEPYAPNTPIRRQYVGYDVQDVDVETRAGAPPFIWEAAKGRFDPGRSNALLQTCAECPAAARERYSQEIYKGVTIHSWGDGLMVDLALRSSPPVFDQLGRAKPLAVQKQYVFGTATVEGVKLLVDVSSGETATVEGIRVSSLAELDTFRTLAESLWELGAYSALLSDLTQQIRNYQDDGTPLLRPYLAFATGIGLDAQGEYMALVLVHSTAAAASENVGLFRRRIEEAGSLQFGRPWKELAAPVDVTAKGTVLLAKLRGGDMTRNWIGWFYNRDPLIVHE